MKKTALFGIAALGLTAVGVPQAFATPTLTVSVGGPATTLTLNVGGSGSYYAMPGSLSGFSWGMILAQVNNPSNNGSYQLSLTINNLTQSPGTTATATFVASDGSFTAPVGQGISFIQSDLTINVTDGIASESVLSDGQLNPGSLNGGNANLPPTVFTSTSGLETYKATGSNIATSVADNTGAFTLQTSDAIVFAPGSSGTTIGNINSEITASPGAVTTPEPATLALLAVGGLGLLAGRQRRAKVES